MSGRVRTLDPERPAASAIAIRGGEIAAVGDDAALRELAQPHTEVIDLAGATVTPGLIDAHSHVIGAGIDADGADLTGASTLDELRAAVAAARRDGDWILGWGLDYNLFAETGIHGSLVEAAAGGAPALLQFSDFHTALATPQALALAGVDGPRAFSERAEVVCAAGLPTGELREGAAIALVQAAVPEPTAEQRYDAAAANLRAFASAGLTGTHLMLADPSTLDLVRALELRGELPVRLVVAFWIHPESTAAEWWEYGAHRDASGWRWRAGVVKFFIDGVIDTGTGWLYEPDSQGEGTAPFWPDPAAYREAVAFFAARGFQCATHATGDRGVREALDAYRGAGAPARGARHRIEHIETLQPADLPRFTAEGVAASMQPQHMMWLDPERGDNWSRRLGDARCERAFPIRSLLEAGATLALGSDWPIARFDPREGMAAARLRRPPGVRDRAPYDDQAISALDALHGYTTGPARTVGEEARIAPGLRADLTVFAHDPVECDADELLEVPIVMTVVGGEIVYRAA